MEKVKIVFFDGVCNLCTYSVQFLLQANLKKNLKFASLQSNAFRSLAPEESESLSSIVYSLDGKLFRESEAILLIAKELRFPYYFFSIFLIVPSWIRDTIYRYVAKHRYKWFGKKEVCYVPTPELSERFIE
jgi:predicted DCC family thiol-disulfide oxidoreductase YuxK